jgi:hypothetical protein
LTTDRQSLHPPPVGKKTEVTDADEALRQNVQEEAAEELDGIQRHASRNCEKRLFLISRRSSLPAQKDVTALPLPPHPQVE